MTLLLLFAILFLLPLAVATALHFTGDRIVDWRNADRSSAGLLPPALPQTPAVVRIFSARTVRWRGIVATHSWIVIRQTASEFAQPALPADVDASAVIRPRARLAGLQERALSTVRAVDGDAEVYVAGIDACFAVTALGAVEVIGTGTFALTPINDAIYRELDFLDERVADKVDPEVDGLRVMDVLRRNPVQYQKGGAGIGGFVQLTSVTQTGITTRILRRWPDHIGAQI